MATSVPPTFEYPVKDGKRFEELSKNFSEKYGTIPSFYARAPGRVNIIGEHIDYCGYAVLPMAIEQDILIAAGKKDTKTLNVANVSNAYEPFSCKTSEISIDKANPQWFHYFLCGFKGVLEHFSLNESPGIDIMLEGTIPKSSGLSSSSAFVCCSALVTMNVLGKSLTKLELCDICQHCEKYIGTEGGGMDQSISFLAQPGTAKLIEFNPIRATDVKLPNGAVFVISNSCVESNKAATSYFNIRVSECRLATQVIAKSKGLKWQDIRKLGDLQQQLGLNLEDMIEVVKQTLHENPYSRQEICDILGVTSDELNQNSVNEKSWGEDSFKLYDRALHVYSEANRVLCFKKICDNQTAESLQALGKLMNESHDSCSKLYECSCSELDELTQLARNSGALGSRLTGAGWGGCAVSLVPADKVTSFIENLTKGYYEKSQHRLQCVKESLFATQPGGGACFYMA